MLKLFELLSRRADMTHDQAMRYWTQTHATIVKASAAEDLKTRRYVNNVGLAVGYDSTPPFSSCQYDGIVAVWQDRSFKSLWRIITAPENGFVPDEPNFLRCRPYLMPVEEIIHKNLDKPYLSKLMLLFTRPLNATHDQAIDHWRSRLVPLELAFWGDDLVGLTTNAAVSFAFGNWGEEQAAYDGCAEYWFNLPPEQVIARQQDAGHLVGARQGCFGASSQMFIREVVQLDRMA